MMLLGFAVVGWPETRVERTRDSSVLTTTSAVLRRGFALAHTDRVVVVIIVATALVNGGTAVVGRLREQRLLGLGLPKHPSPIVWFAGLTLVGIAMSIFALRIVEARLERPRAARHIFVAVCVFGATGAVSFAFAANAGMGAAGVLIASGLAPPVVSTVTTICVNRRTTTDVRATVHSFVSQAEQAGAIAFGLSLAIVAGRTSTALALSAAAVLIAAAALLVAWTRSFGQLATRRQRELDSD